ncbi:MAG: hypothetical protein Q7V20_20375 [Aquabacterium sp.]|uniref:hypothetical protein n=1 Tax=Aquabacterium sp. TaxID=1872578 RepID=UPI0027185D9F|nr:hypothetical protein [Aquabacterium sp.]MDO9005806.1 hypothetical protein [Aquabacterium sp.]
MTNPTTDSRSTRARLNAPQYGLALLKHGYPEAKIAQGREAQATKLRGQCAAILQAPVNANRVITQQISIRDLLMALGLGSCDISCDASITLPCNEMQLDAGALLYEPGKHSEQAFVILSGVLARQQASDVKSGARCGPSSIALQAMAPSTTLINDLLMRTAGAALLRDWRVSYRLRDLPAFARTVAGLSYLASLAEFKPAMMDSDGAIALVMPVSNVATWLALDREVLKTQLKRLERYGVVSTFEEAIRWLDPIKLEALWALD